MYFLYSVIAAVALAVSAPVWLVKMRGKYRAGLGERLGRVPERVRGDGRPAIWVHAVSVGEVLAVSGLIGELRARLPRHRIVISTTTPTGQKLARERFGEANVFYFPLDFGLAIRPYLRALRPELVVLAETEFWPNFLRLARRSGARVAVVNARISDRSFPRYRRFRGLLRPVLCHVERFLAQGEEDRRRLVEIGAAAERVEVSGNLKFDFRPAAEQPIVAAMRGAVARAAAGPVMVCGSTVEGEEPLLLAAFSQALAKFPGAVMVLAPRHPERFADVAELLKSSGLRWWRRSQWEGSGELRGGVFLLDTIGELAAAYALADVAFVGGSLAPRGGHNILEAAQYGAAILVGPHTENFRDMIQLFEEAQAVRVVTAENLAGSFLELLGNADLRRELGSRARQVLYAQAGATARTVAALAALLERAPGSES